MPFVDAPPFDPNAAFQVIGGQPQGTPSLDNFDPSNVNSNLTGMDYLKQYPPEVQAATRAYMTGDVMPTGNPRNNNITTMAKMVAQKMAMDLGNPELADDTLYQQRRKMRTDLASSGQGTIGGIISNGKSAFDHLATLSDTMTNLGNYNGPNIAGGGRLAEVGNYLGNVIAPTSNTLDKIQQANDAALKYGQESTKFYSGTGGGEAERMFALKNLNLSSSPSAEQAGYLQTEKELMMRRLGEKVNQIRDTLGDQYLAQHPVITPDLQQNIARIDANIARLRGQQQPQAQQPQQSQGPAAQPSGLPAGWSVQVH